jgi:phage gp36-like protein
MQFFTKADLERALGGAQILRQLLDPNRVNTPDADSVNDVIDEASAEMASYIQVAVELAGLVGQPLPRALVLKAADMGAYHAWLRGTAGQGPPDHIVQRYENAKQWAIDVGQRRATLGVTPKANLDPPAVQIVEDPCGQAISIEGFRKHGFR